jgi:RNA polymerase sigma factor (sigma-70 family)
MKAETGDWQLLHEYVKEGSQEAFATLVERHVNFVYSTCLREVHDAILAEDTTQAVFLILARKAPQLREQGAFSGWLYQTARFASRNALKQERNRQRHEQNMMQEFMDENASTNHAPVHEKNDLWEENLHQALSVLNNEQRSVILLRFFEGKSVREVGEALGITEKAAERRLARALEKMRRHFEVRGYATSVAVIATLLTENAVQAAPASCLCSALQIANNVAAGGAVSGAAITAGAVASNGVAVGKAVSLSQGVLKAMLINQIKTGVVASIGVSVMTASTVKIAHFAMASQAKPHGTTSSLTRVQKQKTTEARVPSQSKPPLNTQLASRPVTLKAAPKLKEIARPEVTPRTQRPLMRLAQPALPLEKPAPAPDAPPAAPVPGLAPAAPPAAVVAEEKPAAPLADPKLQAGEIAVTGALIAINNGRLVIDVSSYTLPNGKVSAVNPPKPKAILLDAQTKMHVRGAATPLKIIDLQPIDFILAVGKDKGTGEPLPAREIRVWNSVKDGVYGWRGATVPSPQPIPGETINEVIEADDMPPPFARDFENQFPQGDFQQATAGQLPKGWTMSANTRARVQAKDGKNWLAITNAIPNNWGTVRYVLPIQPDWKRLRLVAQLKAKNLKPVGDWWNTARLDFNFHDNQNRIVGYGRGLNLYKSGGWLTLDKTVQVPEGATRLALEPGLFGATGELLIDNISVEANVPWTGRPIRPGFPEGTFENVEGSGWPEGFEPWAPDHLKVFEENGNHFLRLVNNQPGTSAGGMGRFQLPPEWKAFRLRAKMRAKNLKIGKNFWESARITLKTTNAEGERTGGYLGIVQLREDSDWKTLDVVNPIAKDATILEIEPGLLGSTGVLDIDDIQVLDASDEDFLPHLPIVENGPSNTFDELNDRGWPQGWYGEGANPATISTVEEDGNRFLRLSSDKLIYQAVKGRYKLPDGWRGIRVSARLRMKNLKRKPNAQGWESPRVGFIFQTKQGDRAGGFQSSLEMHNDTDWKQFAVNADIPPDAVYIEPAAIFQEAAGTFDVDDLTFEQTQPTIRLAPVHQWTRLFPEGNFELQDQNGGPLHWELDNKAQVIEEEGNKFLRLTNESNRNTVFVSGQWKMEPAWKGVRLRARLRGRNLKKGTNPFDGARLQILFLDAQSTPMNAAPAMLELTKDSDWKDLQTTVAIPAGAAIIKLMPSLSRTAGTLDVDDISIEPITAP